LADHTKSRSAGKADTIFTMPEGPDEHDADLLDEGEDVIDCPHCRREVYADAEQCPHCRMWLSMDDTAVEGVRRAKYRWRRWVVALMLGAFAAWLVLTTVM